MHGSLYNCARVLPSIVDEAVFTIQELASSVTTDRVSYKKIPRHVSFCELNENSLNYLSAGSGVV